MSGLIMQFAYNYTDDNRIKLNNFKTMMAMADYLEKQNLVEQYANFASHSGLQRRNLMIRKSHSLLETFINSRIIYNMLDEQALTEYANRDDSVILKTLDVFRRNAAFPSVPEKGKKQR